MYVVESDAFLDEGGAQAAGIGELRLDDEDEFPPMTIKTQWEKKLPFMIPQFSPFLWSPILLNSH